MTRDSDRLASVPPPSSSRRVRTPTLLQMEAVECGAAALGIVLAHHGLWVPLEVLRHECGVSRDGSKASNLLKAATRYGFVAKGFKYDSVPLLYDLQLPVVLFWNLNHFVVLEGFDGNYAYLNDPAEGPRRVTLAEFDGSFSGIVLTFVPGPDFRKAGSPPDMVPALRRRLVGSEHALLFAVTCGLFLVIPGLVIPTFTRLFVDEYLVDGQTWLLRPLLIAMTAALLVQACLTWLQRACLQRLETKLTLSTSSEFFRHVLRLPAVYFSQRFAGEIGSRVLINDRIANLITGRLVATAIDLTLTAFYLVLMLFYSVSMTAVVVVVSALNVCAVWVSARVRTDATRRLAQERGRLDGAEMYGLRTVETLKATGSEGEFFSRWAGYYAKAVNTMQGLGVFAGASLMVPPFVQTASTAVVLAMGGLEVMKGELTVGMLVAYQTLLGGFTRPLAALVQFWAALQELRADMQRLDDVLRHREDPQYAQVDLPSPFADERFKLAGRVELRNVTFGYSPLSPPLIEGFSLLVEPGRRVALVGASGSGKSTVAKLIAGLYEPWHGQVLFDGVPRTQIPRELLVNSVAVVDQDVFLFGGSVVDNVSMWDSTMSRERIAVACRDASIDGVVEAREDTYLSRVQEGGGNFSGGECQRLEIARALLGEPSIIVLDEATSALDPLSEARITESLRRRGCTGVIIAHRLSTIRDCDEIVVLEGGRVVQRGTHDEMCAVDGPYQRLIALQ